MNFFCTRISFFYFHGVNTRLWVGVFIATVVIADIIEVSRFKDSKHFLSYLCMTAHTADSNTSTGIRGPTREGGSFLLPC
ncbi:MAG: transposase [Treponema sp.]|nr:transposase [Treponema sp.]